MCDGDVQAPLVAAALAELLLPGDLVLAPWERDGHPDHAQVGRGAESACVVSGGQLLSYLVWAWHWARPDRFPWHTACRVDFDKDLARRKSDSVQSFRSQLDGPDPVLRPDVVARFTRDFEVFLKA
jgi:LmbE family N-acetylglucosaminyl deacetylase